MNRIGARTGLLLGSAGGLAVVVGAVGVAIVGIALLWSYRPAARPRDTEVGRTLFHQAVTEAAPALRPCLELVPPAERGNNQVVLRVDVVDERPAHVWVESRSFADPRAADCLMAQVSALRVPGSPDMALRLPLDLP